MPFAGTKRYFLEFRPARLKPGAPVLIVLHGGGQSARKMFRRGNSPHQEWPRLAEREGFLEALAGWAVAKRGGDLRRIYVAGASNGGMMVFRLLMERPAPFAAGAAFIATLPAREMPVPDIARPILIAPATEDPVIRWEGGDLLNRGMIMRSVPDTLAYWLGVHGLAGNRPLGPPRVFDRDRSDDCRTEVSPPGAGRQPPRRCSSGRSVAAGTGSPPLLNSPFRPNYCGTSGRRRQNPGLANAEQSARFRALASAAAWLDGYSAIAQR